MATGAVVSIALIVAIASIPIMVDESNLASATASASSIFTIKVGDTTIPPNDWSKIPWVDQNETVSISNDTPGICLYDTAYIMSVTCVDDFKPNTSHTGYHNIYYMTGCQIQCSDAIFLIKFWVG